MNVTLISLSTPTPFNCGAASALPYHLAKYRDTDVDLEIYSFNINHIGKEMIEASENALNAKIHVMPLPGWYMWMFKLHLLVLRVFLKYPFMAYLKLPKYAVKAIKESNSDAIWIYGEELSGIARLFPDKRCIVTTPDCEAMYYYRELSHRGQFTRLIPLFKNAIMYNKYARMAEDFPTDNVRYHLVGKEDCEFLKNINPNVDATFINHPHYDYVDVDEKRSCADGERRRFEEFDGVDFTKDEAVLTKEADDEVGSKWRTHFSEPKIKLLVAGRYDFYMKDKCDELFEELVKNAEELKDYFYFTFLGKDWDSWEGRFGSAGYETNYIRFAPDYMEELIKHDVQITPIGVGTGTKGKVLDAFANGLMVIGTLRALENIQVVSGESCIQYDKPSEVIEILKDMPSNRSKYEQMAEKGRGMVLTHHGRQHVAEQFFKLFEPVKMR